MRIRRTCHSALWNASAYPERSRMDVAFEFFSWRNIKPTLSQPARQSWSTLSPVGMQPPLKEAHPINKPIKIVKPLEGGFHEP